MLIRIICVIICLSEMDLNWDALLNEEKLIKSGYNLIRTDDPSNAKGWGDCLYYKETMPLNLYSIDYLIECIYFKVAILNKLHNFISFYRSPSQSPDEFENFISDLDLTPETLTKKIPFRIIIYWRLQCDTW